MKRIHWTTSARTGHDPAIIGRTTASDIHAVTIVAGTSSEEGQFHTAARQEQRK